MGLGLCLGGVACLNTAVRVLGDGYPRVLSVRYFHLKISAVWGLASHWLGGHRENCRGDIASQVRAAAQAYGVPEELALAVAQAESDFRPHRISRAGAMGVMQLMPATAMDMGVDDPFDAGQSIDGGVRYLAWLWRRYRRNVRRTVAAYNAGPGRVSRHGRLSIPKETRHYVRRIQEDLKRRSR